MTKVLKRTVSQVCTACGREPQPKSVDLHVPIRKGHVRRAIQAANMVHTDATGPNGLEDGILLMTAVLLVERMATKHACEPSVVLEKIASCFKLKQRLTEPVRDRN